MSSQWQINNRGAAGAAATASKTAPAGYAAGNLVLRLRSLTATLAGSGAGTDQLVVRDGASGSGAIIFTCDLSIPANGFASIAQPDLDLRASPGNAITIEFVSGVATDREDVSAQGDYVPQGTAYGAS